MKTIKSKYNEWAEESIDSSELNYMELALFEAYNISFEDKAFKKERIKLQKMWPKLFIPYPKRGDSVKVWLYLKPLSLGIAQKRKPREKVALDSPIFEEEGNYFFTVKKNGKYPEDSFEEVYWSFANERWEI